MLLDERSPITIGAAILIIGGGAVWLTTMYGDIAQAKVLIASIEKKQDNYTETLNGIKTDLEIIKYELRQIKKEK